jgi:WD40 repeat protein
LAGLLVSGGADKMIYVFRPEHPSEIVWKLEGHTDNVCTLAVSSNGMIASGSWDKLEKD